MYIFIYIYVNVIVKPCKAISLCNKVRVNVKDQKIINGI